MTLRTGGQILVDQLRIQGCDRIFTVPGESFLAVLDALHGASEIDVIVCRQEGGAAMMAEAYGKLTGRPGICFVTRGPGATNASPGLHIAMQDSTPLILFVGQIERGMRDREAFQELDYRATFGALAKWVVEIDDAARIPEIIARAFRISMFLVDVAFATAGYLLALRPLDSHIRTANPYAAGWMAALICYPPFVLMGDNGPLDYHPGTYGEAGWSTWFADYPVLLVGIGTLLVLLTAIYAWATVTFGIRFSNLTHRGILTNGPYAFSRHPAYLSKNLFWLIATVPLLTTGSWLDAVRSTAIMAIVAGIYYWRARTEERHLRADPAYEEYYQWMERNGPVPRFFRWISGKSAAVTPDTA